MMQNILTVVWDFDPTFIDIGGLDIRWYGLMWAIAILAANWFVSNFCRREGLPASVSESAFLWIVLGTFVGARVGHCVFYEPEVYLPEPWRIITDIRDGGMASHGATIGIMLGIWIFVRRNKLPHGWCSKFSKYENIIKTNIDDNGNATDNYWFFYSIYCSQHTYIGIGNCCTGIGKCNYCQISSTHLNASFTGGKYPHHHLWL